MTSTQSPSAAAISGKGPVARIGAADPADQAFMILRAAFTIAATRYDPRPLLWFARKR